MREPSLLRTRRSVASLGTGASCTVAEGGSDARSARRACTHPEGRRRTPRRSGSRSTCRGRSRAGTRTPSPTAGAGGSGCGHPTRRVGAAEVLRERPALGGRLSGRAVAGGHLDGRALATGRRLRADPQHRRPLSQTSSTGAAGRRLDRERSRLAMRVRADEPQRRGSAARLGDRTGALDDVVEVHRAIAGYGERAVGHPCMCSGKASMCGARRGSAPPRSS